MLEFKHDQSVFGFVVSHDDDDPSMVFVRTADGAGTWINLAPNEGPAWQLSDVTQYFVDRAKQLSRAAQLVVTDGRANSAERPMRPGPKSALDLIHSLPPRGTPSLSMKYMTADMLPPQKLKAGDYADADLPFLRQPFWLGFAVK